MSEQEAAGSRKWHAEQEILYKKKYAEWVISAEPSASYFK
jgi:hypothetical protein